MKRRTAKVFCILATSVFVVFAFSPDKDEFWEVSRNIEIFVRLFQEVNTTYVDDVNPTGLVQSGINGMLKTLDPYTSYIPEDRIEDFRTMTTGEYAGIGAVIGSRNGKVTVLMPNEGFAADKAGLRIGDQILEIDGVKMREGEPQDFSKLLKGEAGTEINLLIKRYGETAPLSFKFNREKIKLDNVPYYGMVTEDIGIIQLTDFTRNASREVKGALIDLKGQGAEKIILDVRGNPGGLLKEAIDISNIFVEKGSKIVSTKGKSKNWKHRSYPAEQLAVDVDIPMAVLINRSSASASEIVSGVMQDYDRGVLIGRRTFGKGLVQATRDLCYNAKLKVTVAKYYIPSGRCIQELDYSQRDANGSAEKVPDSLRVAFTTENGRVVYDGGGVAPDLEIENEENSQIYESLIAKGLLFEYAIVYRSQHESIAPAKDFEMTDAAYGEFVKWLSSKNYQYKTPEERALQELKNTLSNNALTDKIGQEISNIEAVIEKDKANDLEQYKDEIKEKLEQEIAIQYYLKKGEVEATFDDDKFILMAIKVLNDTEAYNKTLGIK